MVSRIEENKRTGNGREGISVILIFYTSSRYLKRPMIGNLNYQNQSKKIFYQYGESNLILNTPRQQTDRYPPLYNSLSPLLIPPG